MKSSLKKQVREANQKLVELGLVNFTFGNVSMLDKDSNCVIIKPSGISFENLKDEDMVVLDLHGNIIEGNKKPSSDTATHLEIYKNFHVEAVIHTHSKYASSFAQADRTIDCLGTTHADYFKGFIPVTRKLSVSEIEGEYEKNTGKVIVETFLKNNIDPLQVQACLVSGHGSFVWGASLQQALENAAILEQIAETNFYTLFLNPKISDLSNSLVEKHYFRKHGDKAYYGQNSTLKD